MLKISGIKLKAMMKDKDWSQNKLAHRSGVQDETIRTIRVSGAGGCDVHRKTLQKLCDAFEVDQERLLIDEPGTSTEASPAESSSIHAAMRKLERGQPAGRSSRLKAERGIRNISSRGPLTGTWYGESIGKNGKIVKYDQYKVSHKGERVYFVTGRRLFPKDQRDRAWSADAWFRQGILAGRYKSMNVLSQHRMGSFVLMLDHDTQSLSGYYLRVHDRSTGSGKAYRSIQMVKFRWHRDPNPEYNKEISDNQKGVNRVRKRI